MGPDQVWSQIFREMSGEETEQQWTKSKVKCENESKKTKHHQKQDDIKLKAIYRGIKLARAQNIH